MEAEVATVEGDEWVAQLVKQVKSSEVQLLGPKTLPKSSSTSSWNGISWVTLPWQTAGGGAQAPGQIRTIPLVINPHHLFYLLMRFEELALPSGSLDVSLSHPPVSRPISHYVLQGYGLGDGSTEIVKDRSDTMSLSSFRSVLAPSSASSFSWWSSSRPVTLEPSRNLKLLYSTLTRLPSLKLGPTPGAKLIEGFEDSCPGSNAIPLDVFKSLHTLATDGVDPRGLIGWDRLCIQLASLSMQRSNLDDIGHLLIDAVEGDVRRRRGRPKRMISPAVEGEAEQQKDMPSLAWHFLRHLSLAHNSLTFVPEEPLEYLVNLSSLDLSSNLLNSVPPALQRLPRLSSLDVSDNMIDSVLGISSAIPNITTLILSKNRLDSICGLERLNCLRRVDLRHNYIFDTGEVGRLAPLTDIQDVYVEHNPIVEELPDWRVEVFVEFEREGRKVKLDGSEAGFFERQRIAERLAQLGHASTSPKALPEAEVSDTSAPVRKVAQVKPRNGRSAPRSTPSRDRPEKGHERKGSDSSSAWTSDGKAGKGKAKRIVQLGSPIAERTTQSDAKEEKPSNASSNSSMDQAPSQSAEDVSSGPSSARAPVTVTRTSKATASITASDAANSIPVGSPRDAEQTQDASYFRKGIEALKGEMGDDWLTMLARGVYKPDGRPR